MSNHVVYLSMQGEPHDLNNNPRLPVKLLQQVGAQHLRFLFSAILNSLAC